MSRKNYAAIEKGNYIAVETGYPIKEYKFAKLIRIFYKGSQLFYEFQWQHNDEIFKESQRSMYWTMKFSGRIIIKNEKELLKFKLNL